MDLTQADKDRHKLTEEMRAVVIRLEEDQLWDSIQAKDVPAELVDYVSERFAAGETPDQIRLGLRIKSAHRAPWKKILSAFQQGFRIDQPLFALNQVNQFSKVAEKTRAVLEDAFENGVPVMDVKGNVSLVKGATRELCALIETWGRNQERLFTTALKSGLLRDPYLQKNIGQGNTTIVVQSNIKLPSVDEIRQHQEDLKAKAMAIEVSHGNKR